jgi:hypothetical protein
MKYTIQATLFSILLIVSQKNIAYGKAYPTG